MSSDGASWRDLDVDITLTMDRNGPRQTFVAAADGSIAAFAGPLADPTEDAAYAAYAYRPGAELPFLLKSTSRELVTAVRALEDDVLSYWITDADQARVERVSDGTVSDYVGELPTSVSGNLLHRQSGQYTISSDGGANYFPVEGPDTLTWLQGTFTQYGAVGVAQSVGSDAAHFEASEGGEAWHHVVLPPTTHMIRPVSIGPRGILLLITLSKGVGDLVASIPWTALAASG
ncbi:MAG: hypothetical protein R8J94_21950 [Acidimicrobiia bacterium]|nr:hypothetical protein [Acidimicrobiia bacterium]